MSNCASHAFWLGMTESGGLLTDIDGNNVLHAPWDLHSNPDAPEPNNSAGDETCIRMKGKPHYHSRFDFFILFFFSLNEPKKRDSIILFRNPEHFRNFFFSGNVYNDAICSSKSSGRVRDHTGMGYICEYDASKGKKPKKMTVIFTIN